MKVEEGQIWRFGPHYWKVVGSGQSTVAVERLYDKSLGSMPLKADGSPTGNHWDFIMPQLAVGQRWRWVIGEEGREIVTIKSLWETGYRVVERPSPPFVSKDGYPLYNKINPNVDGNYWTFVGGPETISESQPQTSSEPIETPKQILPEQTLKEIGENPPFGLTNQEWMGLVLNNAVKFSGREKPGTDYLLEAEKRVRKYYETYWDSWKENARDSIRAPFGEFKPRKP